jgi:diguanylate cyclase (GGDEF)-like protein
MKILVADDDRISLRLLEAALVASGHEVALAHDGDEAVRLLEGDSELRLAILDWNMPGRSGVEICARLRASKAAPYVYVILLTSRGETADRVAGLDAGADDFIVKPFHREELHARVRAGARLVAVQAELEVAHALLREQAAHDALTGVLNRSAILSHLDRDLARSVRDGKAVAVVMADIDHFKSVNDRFGHPAGDAVLKETARRMNVVVRASDAMGRYGGEEFIIVASPIDIPHATLLAERIRLNVAVEPVRLEAVQLQVTCSFGVAVSPADGRATGAELIAAADDALYRAKRAGRNRVELAVQRDAVDVAPLSRRAS